MPLGVAVVTPLMVATRWPAPSPAARRDAGIEWLPPRHLPETRPERRGWMAACVPSLKTQIISWLALGKARGDLREVLQPLKREATSYSGRLPCGLQGASPINARSDGASNLYSEGVARGRSRNAKNAPGALPSGRAAPQQVCNSQMRGAVKRRSRPGSRYRLSLPHGSCLALSTLQ